jgi:hypothetical protein
MGGTMSKNEDSSLVTSAAYTNKNGTELKAIEGLPSTPTLKATPTTSMAQNTKSNTWFNKKDLSTKFTNDYGHTANMISFIGSIYSRLAYMNDHQILGHYTKIFGPVIPEAMMKAINTQVITNGLSSILEDGQMFNLNKDVDAYDLKTYQTDRGLSLQFLPWAQKINIINGEQRIDANNANCSFETDETIPNDNLVFISIATSNYGEIYVVGDKRMPNIVNVTFRGTSDAKSAGSYTKLSSLIAMYVANIKQAKPDANDIQIDINEGTKYKEKYLYGIYKIFIEISHTLMESVEYVAKQINPGASAATDENKKVSVVTTGHSLGGGLATVFAFVYVTHISNLDDFNVKYPSLNSNIACFSYGSPRVFSLGTSKEFCYLTTNNQADLKQDDGYKEFMKLVSVRGRITYLRVVTAHDPVTALPKVGFSHPCSEITKGARKNTNIDCLTQVSNSFSSRCRGTRLAMTFDMEKLPLKCVSTKDDTKNRQWGPVLAKMPMGYHTNYLGISYIGGLPLGNVIGNNIKRSDSGNTVCRILLYPKGTDMGNALVSFFDLSDIRSVSNVDALKVRDIDAEKAVAGETAEGASDIEVRSNENAPVSAPTPSVDKPRSNRLQLLKNIVSSDVIVEVPQDIMMTKENFKKVIGNSKPYNILSVLTPPLTGPLITLSLDQKAPTFESAVVKEQNITKIPENGIQMTQLKQGGNNKSKKNRKYKINKKSRKNQKTKSVNAKKQPKNKTKKY